MVCTRQCSYCPALLRLFSHILHLMGKMKLKSQPTKTDFFLFYAKKTRSNRKRKSVFRLCQTREKLTTTLTNNFETFKPEERAYLFFFTKSKSPKLLQVQAPPLLLRLWLLVSPREGIQLTVSTVPNQSTV